MNFTYPVEEIPQAGKSVQGTRRPGIISEFKSGAGDRYGSEAAEALTDPEVYKKLQYLITEGRKKIYCRIYRQKKITDSD